MARRTERRELRLDDLAVIEEWLSAYSKSLTSMHYSVQESIEAQRRIASGQSDEPVNGEKAYVDSAQVREDARKLDDLFPKVLAAARQNSDLLQSLTDLAVYLRAIEKSLTEPMEAFESDLATLGDPASISKNQFEQVASRHRRAITDGVKDGLRAIDEAREKLAAAHTLIGQPRSK